MKYRERFTSVLACACVVTLVSIQGTSAASVENLPQPIVPRLLKQSNFTSTCTIKNHNDTAKAFFRFFIAGDGIAAYMNPSTCSSTESPFLVQSVSLTLFGDFGANWPVEVSVAIWSSAIGDSCVGPGTVLYADTFMLDQASFGIPNVGTVSFADPVCVTGPFFCVVQYTGGSPAPFPSVNFDSRMPGDTCMNWGSSSAFGWQRWNHYFASPLPGSTLIWVDGETQSPLCGDPMCCVDTRGNVNNLGIVDVSDLSLLIAYLTGVPRPSLPCAAEANVNGTGIIDLSDLSLLIAYLTMQPTPTLPNCS